MKHSISAEDVPESEFYQYQGMKYDTTGAKFVSIDLYIPDDWENSDYVRAGLWATGTDTEGTIMSYPIIEFTNNDNNPRFRVWQSDIGWVDIGLPFGFEYNQWYSLSMSLDVDSDEVTYSIGNLVHTMDSLGEDQFNNIILQGHNPMPDGATYDIYWDNLWVKY